MSNNKIYSAGYDSLSSFGEATTRNLDPFGSSTNDSLGLFGGANVSELYPYYLTLNPDFYSASDFANVTLNKGISGSDFVTQTDSVFIRSQFNRRFNDLQFVFEQTRFDVDKQLVDSTQALSFVALSFNRPLYDVITNIGDNAYLHPQKALADLVQNTFDELRSLDFNKGLFDNQYSFDQIQSFEITKLLQDFANPIDLVSIPDGSTFQLNKTLRNTVSNITDDISLFAVDKVLENDDAYSLDQTALHAYKPFEDNQYLNDYSYFTFIKALFDNQVIADFTAFIVGKSLLDSQVINDIAYLALDKPLYDLVNDVNDNLERIDFSKSVIDSQSISDAIQSFDVEKLLQDYANPVDLVNIPDGSTFQLNKTIRNTVLLSDVANLLWYFNRSFDDANSLNDNEVLSFTKALSDNQFLSDTLQSFVIGKSLKDISSINDDITFNVNKTVRVDSAIPIERKYLTAKKTFSDNFGKSSNSFFPLTANLTDLNFGNEDYDFNALESGVIDFDNGQYELLGNSAIFDTLLSVNIGKGLFEYQSSFDQIQSFSVNKVLNDYANPVDLLSVPDGSTFQFSKTLRNTVLPDDLASLVWYFNRAFDDSISNISDLITYIVLGKTPFDEQYVNDELQYLRLDKSLTESAIINDPYALSLNKPFSELFAIGDISQLSFTKVTSDSVNQTDELQSLDIQKVLLDSQSSFDEIQSFAISKLLQDFANPIDLVSIPDGSTFQLNKTLRNTVLPNDLASLVWYFNRAFQDTQSTLDYSVLDFVKITNDNLVLIDQSIFAFDKLLTDLSLLSDLASLNASKNAYDSASIDDNSSIAFNKNITDLDLYYADDANVLSFVKSTKDEVSNFYEITLLNVNKQLYDYEYIVDVIQSFDVEKLLQDFANPVDLVNIPDGSTFQLNKTLRNTVDNISDSFARIVSYNRSFVDLQSILDASSISVSKSFSDSVTAFDEILKGSQASETKADTTSVFETLQYAFGKSISDVGLVDETTSFSVDKTLNDISILNDNRVITFAKTSNDIASTNDSKSSHLTKSLSEYFTPYYYNNILIDQDYENQEIGDFDFNTGDAFVDHQANTFTFFNVIYDDISSFNVSKVISDFANPIDLVSIPDGSTFRLNKGLRNTVITNDNFSLIVDYVRKLQDTQLLVDNKLLSTNKVLSDLPKLSDLNQKILGKRFADFVFPISDITKVTNGRANNEYDITSVEDNETLVLGKRFSNVLTIADNSKKSFSKLLNDYVFVNDNQNVFLVGQGTDYTSNQGELSNVVDSGYLFMTDYADITYFAEDYVGESRAFT